MADALASGASRSNPVEVRVLSWAPRTSARRKARFHLRPSARVNGLRWIGASGASIRKPRHFKVTWRGCGGSTPLLGTI